jgi:hypothetical protein
MPETMYGPNVMPCPTHGDQPVTSIGFRGAGMACGGYRPNSGKWAHPGEITREQMLEASDRIELLIEAFGVFDCCYECGARMDKAPADVREEHRQLTELIDTYYALERN